MSRTTTGEYDFIGDGGADSMLSAGSPAMLLSFRLNARAAGYFNLKANLRCNRTS
jgi:hypothetical protein